MRRALLIGVVLWAAAGVARADSGCRPFSFEGAAYTVCRFDTRADRLTLFNLDAAGEPYGSFSALRAGLQAMGKTLAFAMNAGMFDDALRPIGLYIENRKQEKRLNRRNGAGNFHLKPNGVFYVAGDSAGVMETDAFAKSGLKPDFATQSGPMLVIDGAIHPKFSAGGTSLKRRNGVGAIDAHHVAFAISEGAVNFHSFARLFRDGLGCRNALFFDGSVSSLFADDLGRNDTYYAIGPIVGLAR